MKLSLANLITKISKNPSLIERYEYQTPQTCVIAMKKRPDLFVWIQPQYRSEEICLLASADPNNFAFILNRTPEVITAYLKKDGKLIRFLSPKQQTPEVCLLALKTTPEAYEFVQKGGGDSYEETIESLKALILKRNKQEIKKQLKKAFKLDSK